MAFISQKSCLTTFSPSYRYKHFFKMFISRVRYQNHDFHGFDQVLENPKKVKNGQKWPFCPLIKAIKSGGGTPLRKAFGPPWRPLFTIFGPPPGGGSPPP